MDIEGRTVRGTLEVFFRVVTKIASRDRIPMEYGTGARLYMGEIHTVEAIGRNGGINVTSLADKMGITKGAVSQMTARLLKKGLIKKTKGNVPGNEVVLELSKKGWVAFRAHEKFHLGMYTDIFSDLNEEQLGFLQKVLSKTDRHLDASMAELKKRKPGTERV
jgi:DNA-binding MarR family transcriptional regulator